jgi:Calcineurin-like phosphoesterase
MPTSTTRSKKAKQEPLRFAHPFFTTVPLNRRSPTRAGLRMVNYVQQNLQPVPKPKSPTVMTLADIVGTQSAKDIEQSGTLRFHSVGDTGKGTNSAQGDVADAMAKDFDISRPAQSPAFFFHLGDVIYGDHKDQKYRPEFYEPYMHYPGKIIAIPGNHDGEVFQTTDPTSLRAFLANFCAATPAVPAIAGTIFRETMTQPGVYWLLNAPFVDIIGLYSNVAENPGFISGAVPGPQQKAWLIATLKQIAKDRGAGKRKGLVIATHHPPFSAGGHSGSTEMLADIDDACTQGGIMPDLFLAAHAHSYQRYTRRPTFGGKAMEIPFIVAGTGGINDQVIVAATGQVTGDHTFVQSRKGYGYLLIEVNRTTITVKMIGVDPTSKSKSDVDSVAVNLATNRVV